MDLNLQCQSIEVSTNRGDNEVKVYLNEVKENDLNTEEVAKCVDIVTYFNAKDEDELKAFAKENYPEWFEHPDEH